MSKIRYTLCYHWKIVLGWLLAVIAALLVWTLTGDAQESIPPVDLDTPLIQEELAARITQIFISMADENARNDAFCASMGGQTEVRHAYTYPTGQGYILVDCETADMVYEGGLDRRSSLDSVQQALFAAALTGKEPSVVIYDTDGRIGRFEHRIRIACELAEVRFVRVPNQ